MTTTQTIPTAQIIDGMERDELVAVYQEIAATGATEGTDGQTYRPAEGGFSALTEITDAINAIDLAHMGDTETIDGQEADELFLAAIAGRDGDNIAHLTTLRAEDGSTWTLTAGEYRDGQPCNGWHVRDAEGEFVEFRPTR